jgi:hypothetical protein
MSDEFTGFSGLKRSQLVEGRHDVGQEGYFAEQNYTDAPLHEI